ncbi:MAG: hypothetical protein A3F43_05610 [Gammaproteobacteria bacterium RIFCSPHIGHO2_12_FULL_42_10]|nr:MAG: hypothetical protein A3F43_05610 [Gammaproteobacteria bacterium RIFCSPHIGHO2_12_FULL_42_10]
MFLVDSHCHLNLVANELPNDSIDAIVERAKNAGVQYFLNVCTSLAEFPALHETALAIPTVAVSVGVHPNEENESVDLPTLIKLASLDEVIAIGETGLDYFRSNGELDWQRERFLVHIEAAKATHKPLIIHTRQAKEDTLRLMQEGKAGEVGGVLHCFTEDLEMALAAIDLGFYISFSGMVTFKNSTILQTVAKEIPLNRMLVETDAPYLAPAPMRGKVNEPQFIYHTAAFIANLRSISTDELAQQTTDNFFTLFKGAMRPHV